jgi:hypothetical protein
MTRTRAVASACLFFFATACTRQFVLGPSIPLQSAVEIQVRPLDPSDGEPFRLVDRATIDRAIRLFSPQGWWANDDALVPHWRIDLLGEEGRVVTYWMGTFSDPPRFPCYMFCSGFWAAASTPAGELAPDLIKPLATSIDMFEVGGLLRPSHGGSQPNTRVNPPVRSVTGLACARPAPSRPAGYARR